MTIKSLTENSNYIFIMFGLYTFSMLCHANNHETQTSANVLPMVIEASDFDVEDYIWQIDITVPPSQHDLQITLLNPHPAFPQLNQRVVEIAHHVKLQDQSHSNPANPNKQDSHYTLQVKFLHGVAVKTKPNFKAATAYIRHMCKTYLTHSDFRAGLISQEKNFVSGWIKLLIDTQGDITKIDFLNQTEDKKFNKLVENSFKSMNFYPFNKNGTPISYTAAQAFKITCETDPES